MSYQWEPPDLIGPILKGLQIRSYLEDIKSRREERKQRADYHRMQIEAHQQDRAIKTFQMQRDLADMGAIPALPSDTGQNDEAIAAAVNITPENRRPLLEAPGIGRYRMPSQGDRFKRASVLAEQKGINEGIAEKAKTSISDPNIAIDFPGIGKVPVPRSQTINALRFQRELKNGKLISPKTETDEQTGITYFRAIDAETMEPVEIEFPTRSTPKPKTTTGQKTEHQLFVEEHTLQQESRAEAKDVNDALKHWRELANEAIRLDAPDPSDPKKQPPDPRVSPEWKAARAEAEAAAKQYPWALQYTEDERGYPYLKDIRGEAWAPPRSGQKATTTSTSTSANKKPATAAAASITRRQYLQAVKDLGKAAADAEVKRRNLTIIED